MKINNIAVIGAGTMGHGIAQVFALAGLQVALTDSDAQVLEKAIQRIQANLETCLELSSVNKERPFVFAQDRAATVAARITLASDLADAASQADFIVEAVFEDLDVKHIEPLQLIRDKVARGELGAKAGKGFYDWSPGQAARAIRRRDETILEMVKWLRARGFLPTPSD